MTTKTPNQIDSDHGTAVFYLTELRQCRIKPAMQIVATKIYSRKVERLLTEDERQSAEDEIAAEDAAATFISRFGA